MDVLTWIVSGALAASFLGWGIRNLTLSTEALVAKGQVYGEQLAPNALRAGGAAEVVIAVGLILPWALDVAPVLTPLIAAGLAFVMGGATGLLVHRHASRRAIATPLVHGLLSLFVAVARFGQL